MDESKLPVPRNEVTEAPRDKTQLTEGWLSEPPELDIQTEADGTRSVFLSIKKDDPTFLHAVIDRTQARNTIVRDLKRELQKLGVPYRELDCRIVASIRLKAVGNCTLEEAAARVFGSSALPASLRHWRNKWGLR
jgi:hypothetical protein